MVKRNLKGACMTDIDDHVFNSPITRRTWLLCAATTAAAAMTWSHTVNGASPVATVNVDAQTVYQSFEGWGTSLAWWGHVVGGFSPAIRRDYLNKIFHPTLGLGLTVARYNIGGGENPRYKFLSYRAAVPGYAPQRGTFDWHADQRQRLILHECMAMGVKHIQAFSNSPPYYMTRSGSVTGAKDGGANLKRSDFHAFADYLADVVQHFDHAWGIRFQTLEAFNEPVSMWWKFGGPQEGCHIGNAEQNQIIPILAAALRTRGLTTRVAAPDDNDIDQTLQSVTSYGTQALSDLYQIDTHSYNGSKRRELRNFAQSHNKRLWMSEYGDGDPTGLTMAQRIIQDMRELRPLAWVYWQAVDGGGGWGFLSNIENGRRTQYTINKKYYVMGNFSRFIRPGFHFIEVGDSQSIAGYDPVHHRLVIVSVNARKSARQIIFNLSGFGFIGGRVEAYLTSPIVNLKHIVGPGLFGNRFRVTLPAHSATTFVINDCRTT